MSHYHLDGKDQIPEIHIEMIMLPVDAHTQDHTESLKMACLRLRESIRLSQRKSTLYADLLKN